MSDQHDIPDPYRVHPAHHRGHDVGILARLFWLARDRRDDDPRGPRRLPPPRRPVNEDDAPPAIEMVRQLRTALGWPDIALPQSPKDVWEAALRGVERLVVQQEGNGR